MLNSGVSVLAHNEMITPPIGKHMRNGVVLSTHGTNADNAWVLIEGGWARDENDVSPLTLGEFFYWKDHMTGKYRIGLMGWVESIVIPLATIGIFAMSFTDMSAPWAWMVRCLAGFQSGAVIFHTIREHRKMYRPFDSRKA